jgi:hypothetical protein
MKKLVVICQNNIDLVLNNSSTFLNLDTNQALLVLQEGLITCTSKVPSGEGFPFDLPAVNYASKLIMSKLFFEEFITRFNDKSVDPKILSTVQEIQNVLNEFFSSDIRIHMEEIELLYGYFVQLRLILENEDFSSKEIKNEIKLLLQQSKSQQNENPMLQVIPKRLKKYWKNLFYCYDDKRIPRTNLEIERYFNHLKRIKRRRAGLKNSPTYFTHEGKPIIQIENITSGYKNDSSEHRFIDDFKSKRLFVNREKLEKQSLVRKVDKSFLKLQYQKKIPLLEAEFTFEKLADKIKLI